MATKNKPLAMPALLNLVASAVNMIEMARCQYSGMLWHALQDLGSTVGWTHKVQEAIHLAEFI